MKNKIFLVAFAIFGAVLLLSSFDKSSEEDAAGEKYQKAVTQDTLTNAEKDTIAIPDNIASLYTYAIHPVVTQLSGTAAVKVYLDQSAKSSGNTDWITIDSSASLTNAAPRGILDGTDLLGYRYRLRFSGSGTQSTVYNCTYIFKKKN